MSCCGYTWDNFHGNKKIRAIVVEKKQSNQYALDKFVLNDSSVENISIKDLGKKDALNARKVYLQALPMIKNLETMFGSKSRTYNPLKVGEHSPLPFASSGGSMETKENLFVHLSVEAGSRVLSFTDCTWRADALNYGLQRRGGYWKDSNINISLAGASFHVIDDFPHELMSITLRDFSIIKPQQTDEGVIHLRHLQIDAMSAEAKFPIILQPIPVGVDRRNEHYLEKIDGSASENKDYKNNYWMSNNDKPIPWLEVSISYIPSTSMVCHIILLINYLL